MADSDQQDQSSVSASDLLPSFVNPSYASPQQLAQMRLMANELMKPQPIHHWAQGVAEIGRQLLAGYQMRKANEMQQHSQQQAAYDYDNPRATPNPSGAGPTPLVAPLDSGAAPMADAIPNNSQQNLMAYTAQAAAKRGIDPAVAIKMFHGESAFNPGASGDDNSSFGVPQLHYGGISPKAPHAGLGDEFTKATGLDARDPKNAQATIDFALDKAKTQGWQPWTTTRDKLGLSNFAGIGGSAAPAAAIASAAPGVSRFGANAGQPVPVNPDGTAAGVAPASVTNGPPMAYSPPPINPVHPAVAAMAAQLAPRSQQPVQVAQNGVPQVGRIVTNPWIPEATRNAVAASTIPTFRGDAFQNTFAGAPAGGPMRPVITTGAPVTLRPGELPAVQQGAIGGQPASVTAPVPTVGGASAANPADGSTPNLFGPGSVSGELAKQAAETQGQSAAIGTVAAGAGEQYKNDLASAANYQRTINPLMQAIPALEKLGTAGTGPGTDQLNQFKSFLLSSGAGAALGIDPDKIKTFDEAKKYLTDYVNQTGNTGTNDKLAASFAGNPSVEISNAAAVDVAKTALSLQRMKQAQTLAFHDSKIPESQYSKWALKFATDQDPRAYGIDLMTPEARQKLDKEMPPGSPERAKFNASLKTAMATGVVARK